MKLEKGIKMDTPITARALKRSCAPGKAFFAGAASIAISMFCSAGAHAKDLTPEIVSRVWLDGNTQVAAVTLNGDEIARFKSPADNDEAAEEAEDLAVKLQELITDKKFDATLFVPAKGDSKAVLKHDGSTVCTFDPLAGQEAKTDDTNKQTAAAFDASMKIVNAVRLAFGAPALPASTATDLADSIGSKLEMLGKTFSGGASWYGGRFHGRKTSDGSRYNQEKLTAAHRSLPFGTKLLVKNRKTGDSCV
ncbi:MAG: septal ring lytic transglycosylase RlpA family protein, partial [Candidatus Obscuribacterales bacterium]|nr:septal ring lytic transglycosylase RlpA family protein [Candidatus Obscuribacterales bacterium]